jgi:hypothetical protein
MRKGMLSHATADLLSLAVRPKCRVQNSLKELFLQRNKILRLSPESGIDFRARSDKFLCLGNSVLRTRLVHVCTPWAAKNTD